MRHSPTGRRENELTDSQRCLLANLEFVASIKPGMKPCLKSMTLEPADSWSSTYVRSLSGETKESSFAAIMNIVSEAFRLLESEVLSPAHKGVLVDRLERSIRAISSLEQTYSKPKNTFFCGRVKTEVELMRIRLEAAIKPQKELESEVEYELNDDIQ